MFCVRNKKWIVCPDWREKSFAGHSKHFQNQYISVTFSACEMGRELEQFAAIWLMLLLPVL